MQGPLEKANALLGAPKRGWSPDHLPSAEEHQGSLYDTDTEVIDGWHVFGRGLTAGARTSFEQGASRCEVRAYIQDGHIGVEIPGGQVRMLLLSTAMLAAVKKRSER